MGVFLAVKFLLLVSLLKILRISKSPGLCAFIYGGAGFVWRLFAGKPFLNNVLSSGITLALGFGYFYLLDKYEGDGLIWWPLLIAGLFMAFI
jgi:hypothetical protein